MVVCQACGAENRDRARFCRGCTAPLAPVAVPHAARRRARSSKPVCPACQTNNPADARFCQACGVPLLPASASHRSMPALPAAGAAKRKVVLWGLVLVLAGAGTWWKLNHTSGSASRAATPEATAFAPANGPAALVPAQTQATPGGFVTVDLAGTSPAPGDVAHLSEAERLRLSLERLEREDRARTAALEQQRAATAAEQHRRAELARRRAEATAAATAAAAPAAPTAASPPQPPVAMPAGATTGAAAPPAAPAATVELACAGSSNFFTRDLCRLRECGKASFSRDPTCVRFREMEEARRSALAQ